MNPWVRHPFLRENRPKPPSGEEVLWRDRSSDSFLRHSAAEWEGSADGSIEVGKDSVAAAFVPPSTTREGLAPEADPSSGQDGSRSADELRKKVPHVGDEFVGFRILALLGRGAEGYVFLATQIELSDRPVVLKVSSLQGGEHRSLARLQHTHIVPILSAQDLPELGVRVLCLPYMGGTTLEQVLEELSDRSPGARTGRAVLEILDRKASSPTRLTLEAEGPAREFLAVESYERSIVWVGLCLAEALHHAHLRNLVHWDVKPANILLAADGMPLLLDFHLAQPPLGLCGAGPERLGGTPPFLAPEQYAALVAVTEGRSPPAVDARADIYALAMVLHVALAAKRPVGEGDVAARLRVTNPRVSPGLAAIIARGLEGEPRKRYPTAARFADDLRRHLDDLPLKDVANRSLAERWVKWQRHHPAVLARAGAVAMALAGLAVGGSIAWCAANRRLGDAMGELERGQLQLAAGDHRQAALSLDHGLGLLDSGIRLDRLFPQARETRRRLVAARERNQRAALALELHDLAERVRFLYAAGTATPAAARKLEARLAELWGARSLVVRELTREADDAGRSRLRADLLDLAILWADLRVDLAAEGGRVDAQHEALRILAKAEAEWGTSPVLSQERRFHAQAIGREDPARQGTDDAEPGTAWECYALGRALLRQGALEQAAAALDRAVTLEPRSLWAQFYRGQCALRRRRFDEAVDAFGACVALAPEAVCYYNRSLAYAGLGARERARLDLERARQLDPALTGFSLIPTANRRPPSQSPDVPAGRPRR